MAERTTIHDVAERAGCSITTVSLVLNRKKANIPLETRERVLEAARELNYRPNQLAVGMVTKRTNVLGIILPDSSNMFFASLTRHVGEVTGRAGYSLILANTANEAKRDIAALEMFMDRQVDGIIYVKSIEPPKGEPDRALDIAMSSPVPVVAMSRVVPGSTIRSVSMNHVKGGYMSAVHLLELGHKRVACMTGYAHSTSCIERMEGYKKALAEAGLEFDERLVFESDFQTGKEEPAMDQFLAAGATAIFSFNDIMSAGLYREARKRGLSIPRDLSVIGYDDIPFSDLISPPLTTVRQPVREIGECAARVLLEMLDGKEPEKQMYLFEPELIVRQSTAPPGSMS